MKENKLRILKGNAKLGKNIHTFSIPAGHSCPFSSDCLSKADKATGSLTDGKNTEFRCFSAVAEARFPSVRDSRWKNYDLLKKAKTTAQMATLIQNSLHRNVKNIRIHVSGDFFNQNYFDAWLQVAIANPGIVFYGYTKSLKYWVERLDYIPSNFRLTASYGGREDHLIEEFGLRSAKVVFSEKEAEDLGLPIDHDDSHAYDYEGNFALLLHGSQPKGTKAGKAWNEIKKSGVGGYKKGVNRKAA